MGCGVDETFGLVFVDEGEGIVGMMPAEKSAGLGMAEVVAAFAVLVARSSL